MPTLRNPNPEAVLATVRVIKNDLENALCHAVKLIEMAKEVDSEEWAGEVWDANAVFELAELRLCLEDLREAGTVI